MRLLPAALLLGLFAPVAPAQDKDPPYTRTEDVIYGRKDGMALTLDVFAPPKPNGVGVVFCVSGGWVSAKESLRFFSPFAAALTGRGYTVFAALHGSQPKYTIPEAVPDIHRAVRFVRHHAKRYGVDPDRLGITGISAGGHLSLMMGVGGKPGLAGAPDPVDRVSSRVQAVGCFVPPTDFLNWGEEGVVQLGTGKLTAFRPPFEFWEREPKTNKLVLIADEERRKEIGRTISPAQLVTKDAAPTLIVHGEKDELVPVQQAEWMVGKLKTAGVPAELVVREGMGHVWPGMDKDVGRIADWFDKHLAMK